MTRLPEILRRKRDGMRRLLAAFVVPPWEAETMLWKVVKSIDRESPNGREVACL